MAVGSYVRRSGVGATLAEFWNGTTWHIQPTPNLSEARVSSLQAVACPAPSACTAVGFFFTDSGVRSTLAERWNGASWAIEPTPNPAGALFSELVSVACNSSSVCTAVGDDVNSSGTDASLAQRWNGAKWQIQPTPNPSGAQFSFLDGVACTSPSACTAVGASSSGTLAERWNGTNWQTEPTPNPSGAQFSLLSGVACTVSSACTAVGGYVNSSGTFVSLAERWNGAKWSIQFTPNPTGAQFIRLFGVACTASSACTAVGGYTNSSGTFVTLAERWDGSSWQIQPTPPGEQDSYLSAVACVSSPSTCTAVGSSHGSGTPLSLAERWDGTKWQIETIPSPPGAEEFALSGVACPATSICFAVGGSVQGNATLAERWDGTSWRLQATPTLPGAGLGAVSCTSSSACTAVGGSFSGTLAERWDGTTWSIQSTPNPPGAQGSGLDAVACASRANCMATGASFTSSGGALPLAERWDGKDWTTVAIPNPPSAVATFLGGVSCTSPSACTTVGEQHAASGVVHTIAERWNGEAWRIQPTPNPPGVQFASLSGVACTGPSACLAVGFSDLGTLVERWDGTSWSIQQTPSSSAGGMLSSVDCHGASACTAVGFSFNGFGATILAERWNGSTWRIQPTPLVPGASNVSGPAVACPGLSTCIAVGGYENDGPDSVTLAELWNGSDENIQSAPIQWALPRNLGSACARTSRIAAAFGRTNSTWSGSLPWCRGT